MSKLSVTGLRIMRAKIANNTYPDLADVKQLVEAMAELVERPASVAPTEAFRVYTWRQKWFA